MLLFKGKMLNSFESEILLACEKAKDWVMKESYTRRLIDYTYSSDSLGFEIEFGNYLSSAFLKASNGSTVLSSTFKKSFIRIIETLELERDKKFRESLLKKIKQ